MAENMIPLIFCLSLLLPSAVLCKDYFTAAVFEHRPQHIDMFAEDPLKIKSDNLQYFRKAAEVASQNGADILVFNEYGTFVYAFTRENFMKFAEHVPNPEKHKFNPCTENAKDRHVLYTVSCLARENSMYIVVNLADVQPCEASCDADQIQECNKKCPDDGVYFYNTDVAFDREGNIVARYHKRHPYFEIVNTPEEPEYITFETDFGKFGMIVCFDSVFEEAIHLVEDYGIDTLLFPTYWFDDIVLFNAIEWQQSWGLTNRVNFLAANTHAPGTASLGSGIYSKDDGALVYTYDPDGKSKLLLANVRIKGNAEVPDISTVIEITPDNATPKIETGDKFPEQCYDKLLGPPPNRLEDYRCLTEKLENFTAVKLEKSSGKVKACNNGFCCFLSYTAKDMNEDFYLAAFDGLNNVRGFFHWSEEACILTRCDPFEGKPCRLQPSISYTVFESLQLKGKFHSEKVYATVSKTKNRLASKREWDFKRNDDETTLTFKSDSSVPLLRAGLYGRDYERDPLYIPFYQY